MGNRNAQIIRPINGVDLDSSKESIKPDKATFLKNAINAYGKGVNNDGQNHNEDLLTPLLSNINNAIFADEPFDGESFCIGAKYDRKLNQFFYFVWHVQGFHSIWVYSADDNTARRIMFSSAIPRILPFDPKFPITSIDIVLADVSGGGLNQETLQRLLYWTDGKSEPRKINVDKALAGGYSGLVVGAPDFLRRDDQYTEAVKLPPLDVVITSTIANPDPTFLLNFVYNKQYQFRYRYYYDDGEHSTWSAISTLAYNIVPEKNFIELSMEAGSSLVRYVELAYRLGNIGDWKSYDKILRSDIVLNVIYPYNNTTNIFIYKFYGNKAYTLLDQADTNRLFDLVPLKTFSQEFVEENVLLYGDMLEGYDNLAPETLEDIEVGVTYADYGSLTLTLTGLIPFTFTGASPGDNFTIGVHLIDFQTGNDTAVGTYTVTVGDPSPLSLTASPTVINNIDFGDQVYLKIDAATLTGAATASIDAVRTLIGTYTNVQAPLVCGSGDFSVIETATGQSVIVNNIVTFDTIVSDLCNTWVMSGVQPSPTISEHISPNYAIGLHQLKQGGRYKIGIVCYDAALRSTFVQEVTEINIEPIQENSKFQIHTITVNWNNTIFPDWVFFVKVCRTKNLNIDRSFGLGYLQFGISDVDFLDYDGTVAAPNVNTRKVRFTLAQLIQFNTDYYENTTTSYTWTQGDRIQFIRNGNGTYFDFTTFGLIDKELSTDPAAPDVTFILDYDASLAGLVDGAWVELYTPAKEEDTDIYYEIGDFIQTRQVQTRNTLGVATTVLETFDTFPIFWDVPYILAPVNDSGVTPFEHHSIYAEGTVPSNGEDGGRVNVINVDARQLWYPARTRWSNAYLPNSFYNGLSTYKEENKKDYFRQYGGIRMLHSSGTNILILQEDNCFRAILNKKLVTLADGSVQLTATDTFLSDPIEINGSYGCQNPESFVFWNEIMYWADTKRAAIVQCDWRQAVDIARTGSIKSYAERKLKYILNYNAQEHLTESCLVFDFTSFLVSPILITDTVVVVYDGTFTIYSVATQINTAVEFAAFLTGTGLDTFYAIGEYIFVSNPTHIYGGEHYGGGFNYLAGSNFGAAILIFTIASTTLPAFYYHGTCNNNFFLLPAGFDPKTNSYVLTFFKAVTTTDLIETALGGILPYYSWVIGTDFPTGDAIEITITTDGIPNTNTFSIETIEDILDAVNSLLPANAGGITDEFTLIENDTTLHVIVSSLEIYGNNLVIGDVIYLANTTSQFEYTTDENSVENVDRSETIMWNIVKQYWRGWVGFTPEYFCYADGKLEGLSLVTFQRGIPFFHNLQTIVTTYNRFYTFQTNQYIQIVANESPQTTKRWQTMFYDSKNESKISSVKYEAVLVKTSTNQESSIPLEASIYREGNLWCVFFRNTALGGTLQSGEMLVGEWIEVLLKRDDSEGVVDHYSEFSKAIINFFTSSKTY